MRRIVVCYKWVVDEADIKIKTDLSIDFCQARGKISDYDKNAIEAAVQAAATLEGKTVGLTFGNASTKLSLKDALSRGLEECFWIKEEGIVTDGVVTSNALTAALRTIEDVALVICSEGASDTFDRQTAPRMAALLNWPVITSVRNMKFEGNTLIAQRKLEDCLETVKVELPAIVAVLPEINRPPIPGLKAVLAAGKKPVSELTLEELGVDSTPRIKILSLKGYVADRKRIIIDKGDAADNVTELVALLRKEGVL
jgi:electron transfer flavoprotein beta subunit